jgi:hypothetical protein
MPESPASSQSSTRMQKTNDAGTGPVSDQADAVQHFFLFRYRTEIMDAGIPMLALVSSMPMHSCVLLSIDRYGTRFKI